MKTDRMVVGICGKAKHGKDSLAAFLVANHGFMRVAFADALKEMAQKYFGLSPEECHGVKTPESRRILQGLGVFAREEISRSFWVDKAMCGVDAVFASGHDAVITDVRFREEVEAIKSRGGIIVRIVRPQAPPIEFGAAHESETQLDGYAADIEVVNDGSLADLEAHANSVAMAVMEARLEAIACAAAGLTRRD